MQRIANFISNIILFFYSPFKNYIPLVLFKYGFCGGLNLVFDWVLYYIVYHFIALPLSIDGVIHFTSFLAVTPHILSLCIVFPITLLSGFWLNKYVTFTQSTLRGRRQLVRYILIVMVNLLVNYAGLKLCVEVLSWYPTPSKMLITVITVIISFLGQRYFSFKS